MGEQTTRAERADSQTEAWRAIRHLRLVQAAERMTRAMKRLGPGVYAADAADVLAVREELERSRKALQGKG